MTKKTKKQKKMMKLAKKLDKRRERDMRLSIEAFGAYEPPSKEKMRFFHALLESPLVRPRPWLGVEVSDEDIAVPLPSYNERADAEMNQMLDDWGIQR
jgi:hypothetical protein